MDRTKSGSARDGRALALYITAPDLDCARMIARTLIDARLAACVNILPGALSLFHWDGAVGEESEVVMIAKTTRDRADAAIDLIVRTHPYDVPCVTRLDISGGHAPFLEWIAGETEEGIDTSRAVR